MIWGFGFIATKWTLIEYEALWANSLRYLFSAVFALPILLWKKSFHQFWARQKFALFSGLLLFGCMYLQVLGLEITTVAKSGFLTTFYVLFTPLLSIILFKEKYPTTLWVVVGLSLLGVALMCDLKWESFNLGDLYTLGCAVFGAAHILTIGRLASSIKDPVEFNFMQCFSMGVFGVIGALILEGPPSMAPLLNFNDIFSPSPIAGFLFLSLFSSLLAFSLQIFAQQSLPPHQVALIFLMESPFAAFFAWLILNEGLSLMNMLGAFCVLISVLAVPLMTKKSPPSIEGDPVF